MLEARLTCQCAQIRLPDLMVTLNQGDVLFVDAEVARKSGDLQLAMRAGGVNVHYLERCQEQRDPTPRIANLSEPPKKSQPKPIVTETVFKGPSVDVADLVNRIRVGLRSDLGEMLKTALMSMPVNRPSEIRDPAVVDTGTVIDMDTPRFIPQNLVRDAPDADITIDAVQEQGGQVDAATAALRGMRKRSGKKRDTA